MKIQFTTTIAILVSCMLMAGPVSAQYEDYYSDYGDDSDNSSIADSYDVNSYDVDDSFDEAAKCILDTNRADSNRTCRFKVEQWNSCIVNACKGPNRVECRERNPHKNPGETCKRGIAIDTIDSSD